MPQMDPYQQQQPSALLPIEILQVIGSLLDPISVYNACLVNKLFSHCLRDILWRDIPPRALTCSSFINQFPHSFHLIRHLSITLPEDTSHTQELFHLGIIKPVKGTYNSGQDDILARNPHPPIKNLNDFTLLESVIVNLSETIILVENADNEIDWLLPVNDLLLRNASTLRRITITGLKETVHTHDLLNTIATNMEQTLESLSLLGWYAFDPDALFQILLHCQGLQTLCLETDDPYIGLAQLSPLKDWRTRYLRHQSTNLAKSNDSYSNNQKQQLDPSKHRLTKIKNLYLDRSALNLDLVMVLCGLMPELRLLSLRDTTGLTDHLEFFGDDIEQELMGLAETTEDEGAEEEGEDVPDTVVQEEEDNESHGTQESNEQSQILSELSEEFIIDVEDNLSQDESQGTAIDQDGLNNHEDAGHPHDDQESHMQVDVNSNEIPEIAPVDILTGTAYIDGLDIDGEDWDDDNDDDNNDDNDDNASDNYYHEASDYGDDYSFDDDHYVGTPLADHILLRALDYLHTTCPGLCHFDFSDCRSDDLDETFFERILHNWGATTLEGFLVRSTRVFTESIFTRLLELPPPHLVHLDLSYKSGVSPFGGGIRRGEHFNDLLGIFENCPNLESLFLVPYTIDASEIQRRQEANWDWVCTRLRHLSVCIEYRLEPWINERDNELREQEKARILRRVFQQLARLSSLETFEIQGGTTFGRRQAAVVAASRGGFGDGSSQEQYLEFRLDYGLDQLSTWKCLKSLDLLRLGPHGFQSKDLAWVAYAWTGLERIDGFYDPAAVDAIARRQKALVDEALRISRIRVLVDHLKSSGTMGQGLSEMKEAESMTTMSALSSTTTTATASPNKSEFPSGHSRAGPRPNPTKNELLDEYETGLAKFGTFGLGKEWHSRAPLLPEAIRCASGSLPSLNGSRLPVSVDKGAMERALAVHDLQVFELKETPVADSNPRSVRNLMRGWFQSESLEAESKDDQEQVLEANEQEEELSSSSSLFPFKLYVGYIHAPVSNDVEFDRVRSEPGGIANSELMANVMRPRQEGRSPSPLGTWY